MTFGTIRRTALPLLVIGTGVAAIRVVAKPPRLSTHLGRPSDLEHEHHQDYAQQIADERTLPPSLDVLGARRRHVGSMSPGTVIGSRASGSTQTSSKQACSASLSLAHETSGS